MIYFDSAATTLQKPSQVAQAMGRAVNLLSSPGRGGHRPSQLAAETAYRCRELAADLFHLPDPQQVVFTMNATHGLNIAIRTLVKSGDRVVISPWEHNAVTRTLQSISDLEIQVANGPLFDKIATISAFQREITPQTSAVIVTHMSNVYGFILPVEEIGQICKRRGVPFIVDASQSAGALPVDAAALSAAYIAMPGHKGLFGPQGTGLLLCDSCPCPLMTGGTGSESILQYMPNFLPDCAEAGTHNMPGIAGLLEGIQYVERTGIGRIHSHESSLIRRLGRGLDDICSVETFLSRDPTCQGGVLSVRMLDKDCEEVGALLAERGICIRPGLHCAPLAHQHGGTLDTGTIRISVTPFNTAKEVDQFLDIFSDCIR